MSPHDGIQPARAPSVSIEQEEVDLDTKHDVAHVEVDAEKNAAAEIVIDNEAADYVDYGLVIDEAENKRLRHIINRR